MSIKKRNLTAAIINAVIFAATVLCLYSYFTEGGDGNMKDFGFGMFRYFTVDSNVFCALASLCLVPFQVAAAINGRTRTPRWTQVFKFLGTASVTLTLLVVVVFLWPMTGDFRGMFGEANLHMHLVGPLLAVYSFCFLEHDNMLERSKAWLPLIPIMSYGILYFIMVVIVGEGKGGWPDFYMFNLGGRWYITFIVIAGVSLLISIAEFALNQRRFRNVRRTKGNN